LRSPFFVEGDPLKVTVCELPHEPGELAVAWKALREHVHERQSELVLLPEFAFVAPPWNEHAFDSGRWAECVALCDAWLRRLRELETAHVVGARPVTVYGRHFNEGFLWSRPKELAPLRRKFFMPDEPGGWEARWFARGDRKFPRYTAGGFAFGLNICTELWALESYATYAAMNVHAVLCPRATTSETRNKWLAIGTVAAVRAGAYCLSSNRVTGDGAMGGMGWIIGPDGEVLALTSRDAPFATVDIELDAAVAAKLSYPRYVLADPLPHR
jgi:N-carbamoylputrescine amidase